MKQVRSLMTRLINGINDTLNDENDLFGFPGISKKMIHEALSESSALVDEIERRKETFDVIVFKRNFANWGKAATEFLHQHAKGPDAKSHFDSFLNTIAQIKNGIKDTYLLTVKDGLRPEAEISTMKRYVEELGSEKLKLTETINDIIRKSDISKSKHEDIVAIADKVKGLDTEAVTQLQEIKTTRDSVVSIFSNIEVSSQKIQESKLEIEKQITSHQKHEAIINQQVASVSKALSETQTCKDALEQQITTNKDLQDEIRNTIDDANRSSMAGSFKRRKDELSKPLAWSETFMVVALLLLCGVAIWIIFAEFKTSQFSYRSMLIKFPILLPLVWIAWFYTKKVGHLSRISEDYAFKYAAAMAFEGYNKYAQENDSLCQRLLDLSIENMGANPIRLYGDESNHAGPIPEAIKSAGDTISKLKHGT